MTKVRQGWSPAWWVAVGLAVVMVQWAGAGDPDPADRYQDLPVASSFDWPVGPPDASGYYNAQGFGDNQHLGEDWNGVGGGDTDLGDPVHAIGLGMVVMAAHAGPGWGNVVRVVHRVKRMGRSDVVESVYAHLDEMLVEPGMAVTRGQPVGTIGDADGRYAAHLHFEIRRIPDLPMGPGYSADNGAWLDPSAFIRAHRR